MRIVLLGSAIALAGIASAAPVAAQTSGCVRWVDPNGDDAWAGGPSKPWATLEHAAVAVPDEGCTVWIRDGVYLGRNQLNRSFTSPTVFRAEHRYGAVFGGVRAPLDIGKYASHMVFRGLRLRQWKSGAGVLVYISGPNSGVSGPNHIVLRDNVIHDSFGDDLLKIRSGAHHVVVRGNVFYNQAPFEQHIDVNSATDVTISDNIFFNDLEGSGRTNDFTTKHYIVVKDSNGEADVFLGSRRVTIERNVFLRWQGGEESFISIGNDGREYLEARQVHIANNLMLGDGTDPIGSALRVLGAKAVTFVNNSVSGNLPSTDYAFWVGIKGANPPNEDVTIANNIWTDPTGTMSEFSDGNLEDTLGLRFTRNLYWNGGDPIPDGDLLSPVVDDERAVMRDPLLRERQRGIVLPVWTGDDFRSGNGSIRREFVRLVRRYGAIPLDGPAVGRAIDALAPVDDILGHRRGSASDLGAYEARG